MGKVEIIEAHSISKYYQDNLNEDGFLVNDAFVAVVDGATSKTGIMTDGRTGGQIMRDNIIETIASLPADIDCTDAVRIIQSRLLREASEVQIGRAAASAIIYSIERHEIWAIGDCQMLVGDKEYTFKKRIDELLAELRGVAIRALIKSGKRMDELREHDEARDLIQPFLLMQLQFENTDDDYGYCVLNNNTAIDKYPFAKIERIKVDGREVVLASDGYPRLMNTFEESEHLLQTIIERDPLCYMENPGTKGLYKDNNSYDDRTYVRFRIVD